MKVFCVSGFGRWKIQNHVLAQAEAGQGCSHFWQGLMSVNPIFQQHCERIMKMGRKPCSGLISG
jgi:hypothetical protein